MATLEVTAHLYGCVCTAGKATYPLAHDVANADWAGIFPGPIIVLVSILSGLPSFEVARSELSFDTSPAGAGAIVTGVILDLWFARPAHGSEDDPGHMATHVVEGVHGAVVDVADFGLLLPKTVSGGEGPPYADILPAPGSYHAIPLNAIGRSWINLTGITKLALRCWGDIANLVPTGMNDVEIYVGANLPKLRITYIPYALPTKRDKAYALAREEL